MEKDDEIRNYLQNEFEIMVRPGTDWREIENLLSAHIDQLIQYDFGKLVSLLYRIDVSESKLRTVLAEHTDTHASELIAQMVLERQLQKIESREKFKQGPAATDEEKW